MTRLSPLTPQDPTDAFSNLLQQEADRAREKWARSFNNADHDDQHSSSAFSIIALKFAARVPYEIAFGHSGNAEEAIIRAAAMLFEAWRRLPSTVATPLGSDPAPAKHERHLPWGTNLTISAPSGTVGRTWLNLTFERALEIVQKDADARWHANDDGAYKLELTIAPRTLGDLDRGKAAVTEGSS